MPLGDHLEELRKRLIHALLGLFPIAMIALAFGKYLLEFLLRPLFSAMDESGSGSAQATGPLETFGAYVKVSLIASVIVGAPWILWQLWRFVSPGLYNRERRFIYILLPLSTILTTVGVSFLYFVVMPLLLSFFLSFSADIGIRQTTAAPLPEGIVVPILPVLAADPPVADLKPGMHWINEKLHQARYCISNNGITPVILTQQLNKDAAIRQDYRVTEYISLLLSLALAFAVSFQTPVVVLLLGWSGIVNTTFLNRYRKHAVFVSAIIAAVLTPGDLASMILLWVPLYLLYELGVLLLYLMPADKLAGKRLDHDDSDDPTDPTDPTDPDDSEPATNRRESPDAAA